MLDRSSTNSSKRRLDQLDATRRFIATRQFIGTRQFMRKCLTITLTFDP